MAADAHQSFLNSKFQLMREAADKCDKLGDDYKGRATVAKEFVNVLEESSEYLEDSCENIEDATENVNKLLEEVYSVLKSPSGQALLDDLILDLPEAMLKILNRWENSWSLCERIMVHACQNGNPREMIAAIGEKCIHGQDICQAPIWNLNKGVKISKLMSNQRIINDWIYKCPYIVMEINRNTSWITLHRYIRRTSTKLYLDRYGNETEDCQREEEYKHFQQAMVFMDTERH